MSAALDRPIGEVVRWSKTGRMLNIIDPEVLKRLMNPSLSASTAKDLSPKSCAAKWVFKKLLPRVDNPFDPAPLGTAGHEVLELLHQRPQAERTPETARAILDMIAAREWGEEDHLPVREDWIDAVWSVIERYFDLEDPTAVDCYQTELELIDVKVGGVPFIGYVDRTDNAFEGFTIVDYKTGARVPNLRWGDDHGDQIRLYAAAMATLEGIDVEKFRGKLYYTAAGVARDVPISKAKVAATVKQFVQAWERMKELQSKAEYPTHAGPLCGWCPAVKVCFSAEANGHTAKVDTPTPEFMGMKPVGDYLSNGETQEAPAPVHHTGVNETTGGTTMTYMEAQPSIFRLPNGAVNHNSWAAAGLHGLVQTASEQLRKAGRTEDHINLRALAFTLARVVAKAEMRFTKLDGVDWQRGINARMRGHLRTALDVIPPPWGGDAEAWRKWELAVMVRMTSYATLAADLGEIEEIDPAEAAPWTPLVGGDPVAASPAPEAPAKPARKPAVRKPKPDPMPEPESAAKPEAEPGFEPEPDFEPGPDPEADLAYDW